MTALELSDYVKSKNKKLNLDRKKILENYLKPLSEHGYLEEAQDPRNKSRNIYWIAKQYEGKEAGFESTLIDISALSDSGVRVYIEKYLECRFDSGNLTIFDSENQKINPEELYKTVTSIDIHTPQISHDFDNIEVSTSVDTKQEKLSEMIPQITTKELNS